MPKASVCQRMTHMSNELAETDRRTEVLSTRIWDIDRNLLGNSPRPDRHHRNAGGQVYSLEHVVCDEKNGHLGIDHNYLGGLLSGCQWSLSVERVSIRILRYSN